MDKIRADISIKGQRLKIFFLAERNRCEVREFLESLDPKDLKGIMKLMERLADQGIPPKNQEWCKPLRDKIWEMKKKQIRLFFFRYKNGIVVTHGIKKKQNKVPKKEIDKAIVKMKKFLEDKNG